MGLVQSRKLDVLFFKDANVWVGQCLQYDIAVQGESLPEALDAMEAVILDRIHAAAGGEIEEPFEGIPKAPGKYWDRYSRAVRISPDDIRSRFSEMTGVPPAFMIEPSDLEARVY